MYVASQRIGVPIDACAMRMASLLWVGCRAGPAGGQLPPSQPSASKQAAKQALLQASKQQASK